MFYPVTSTTKRLNVRPLCAGDHQWWNDYFESEECMRYMPPDLLLNDDPSRAWINKQLRRYEEGQFGLEVLTEKKTGNQVGQCGLITQVVDGTELVEVGYHLLHRFWKNGYASEAAQFFRDLAFNEFNVNELISIIHTENSASEKVASRNGMELWKRTTFKGIDANIFRIERSTWLQRH